MHQALIALAEAVLDKVERHKDINFEDLGIRLSGSDNSSKSFFYIRDTRATGEGQLGEGQEGTGFFDKLWAKMCPKKDK